MGTLCHVSSNKRVLKVLWDCLFDMRELLFQEIKCLLTCARGKNVRVLRVTTLRRKSAFGKKCSRLELGVTDLCQPDFGQQDFPR